jgi:two-component system, NtrC family, sensor histidine kinase HydH
MNIDGSGRVEDARRFVVRWDGYANDVPACTVGELRRIRSLFSAHKLAAPSDRLSPLASHRLRLGWLVAMVLTLGTLQHLASSTQMQWLYILQRLYYIPVVLAGLIMGWRGGLGIALLAGAAFAIGTPSIWTVSRVDALDQCLEVCVFCLVGTLSGVLTDRQRKQEANLLRTTNDLRQAQQELEKNFENLKRAERIYGLAQLSAGLAHEIRTPLASLEGAAALVQRETQSEERRREFLDIIQKESRRLNRLLTSFLEFARPRHPDLQKVEIDEVLDSIIILVQHAGDASRIKLRKRIEPGLPMLECDPEQLKQVLLSLVMNANQAMRHGGTVLLEARRDGTNISIDVHDQGSGIDEHDLDRIFDPFFTTKENGTGLGLSVAHQIVSQHRGMLTVTRNSRQGVTIRVSLPLPPGEI